MCKNSGKIGDSEPCRPVLIGCIYNFTTIILPMASPSSAGIHKLKEAGELIGLTCHLCLVGMVCDEKDATRSGRRNIHIYIYTLCVYTLLYIYVIYIYVNVCYIYYMCIIIALKSAA